MNPLFTIGHSTHGIDGFLGLLHRHGIEVVADVRSQPYSRRFPQFSRDALQTSLREAGIRYVFLGRELGARRDEPECYVGHRADYREIAKTAAFRAGLERLREGLERFRVSLLCAEKDPLDCHRTILVCRHARTFAGIQHIRADGSLESHADFEARLLAACHLPAGDLFQSAADLLERAYDLRGEQIAWTEPDPATVRDEP